ncbi:MAG TPA: YdeI/OmpD-associated family protein, partial [Sediminibacterium sp.]|nr:YdeI/OmpD-associated family protein [Sediminibacterium sp.]
GRFILPLNAAMRRQIKKKKGAVLEVSLELDKAPLQVPEGFAECLEDAPEAKLFFEALKPSQRNYFIKWMSGVKSDGAKAKRMALVVNALCKKQDFVTMIRSQQKGL